MTNREWLESLSDDELSKFLTVGVKLKAPNVYISFDRVRFTSSTSGIKQWLSEPCKWEEEKKDV